MPSAQESDAAQHATPQGCHKLVLRTPSMNGVVAEPESTQTGTYIESLIHEFDDIMLNYDDDVTPAVTIQSHTVAVTGPYRPDRCFSTIVYHLLVGRAIGIWVCIAGLQTRNS